jgi:hypothetical protein
MLPPQVGLDLEGFVKLRFGTFEVASVPATLTEELVRLEDGLG